MNLNFLDFEQPIAELQEKIDELRNVGSDNAQSLQQRACLARRLFTGDHATPRLHADESYHSEVPEGPCHDPAVPYRKGRAHDLRREDRNRAAL